MLGTLNVIETIVVGVAVLLFGRRLPEVGRTLGKGIRWVQTKGRPVPVRDRWHQ